MPRSPLTHRASRDEGSADRGPQFLLEKLGVAHADEEIVSATADMLTTGVGDMHQLALEFQRKRTLKQNRHSAPPSLWGAMALSPINGRRSVLPESQTASVTFLQNGAIRAVSETVSASAGAA